MSDYDMPGQNGIEFLETVREDHPDLPFILFTGKGSEEIAAEAIEAGVDSYLQKEAGTDQYTVLANRIRNHVEQYLTRRRARALEQEYELVAETATDAFWVYDLTTGTIQYDGLCCFGYDEQRIDGDLDWWIERLHSDDRERIVRLSEALAAGEEWAFDERDGDRGRFSKEFRFRQADGTYADCSGRGIALFEDGDPVKLVGTMTDVTERRDHLEHEESLQRERDRFRAIFEEAFDAMLIADDDGRYVEVNESATELFGLPRDELLGRSIREFAPDDFDFEAAWQEFQASDAERGTFPLVRPDGTERLVEYTATTDIVPGRHLSILRDVTEHKAYERELEHQNERLAEFASIVSHDLRNPLNVAEGRLELARAERESQTEHLDAVARAHDRMRDLIDDLLTLSREGDRVNEMEAVDLAELSEVCWRTVATDRATLVTETDRTIEADRSRLQQLLTNLFRNAVEHGGEDVTITVGDLPDGFYVADDGPGVPDDECEEIFETGYTTATDGTGFGLAIVDEIAEAHGWEIGVTDSADGGARFDVSGVAIAH